MRPSRDNSLVFYLLALLLAGGCATSPSQDVDMYTRNVVFTVPGLAAGTPVVSGFTAGGSASSDANAVSTQDVVQAVLRFHGLRKVSQFSLNTLNLEAIVADIGEEKSLDEVMGALAADERVSSVETVKSFKLMSYNDPYYALQNSVVADRIERIHRITTGKNVTVGMVDTGVDRLHPELRGRIVYSRNLVEHDQLSFDRDEHGTAVAGVIGSQANNDLGIVGVAPDVGLMVFKACHQHRLSRKTECDSVSIIRALNDVLHQRPDILNLSLAGPADPLISSLLERAFHQGIILVAAVDESGPAADSFPASMKEVIAVGTTFNQEAGMDMLLAPGTDILTTAPGSTYGFKTGSSMATAYVSGIIALMKERDPMLAGVDAYERLRLTARESKGRLPVVDMCSALQPLETADYCESTPQVAANTAAN